MCAPVCVCVCVFVCVCHVFHNTGLHDRVNKEHDVLSVTWILDGTSLDDRAFHSASLASPPLFQLRAEERVSAKRGSSLAAVKADLTAPSVPGKSELQQFYNIKILSVVRENSLKHTHTHKTLKASKERNHGKSHRGGIPLLDK